MCKTLYKKPIYERAKEIIKNREKKIDDLKKDERSKFYFKTHTSDNERATKKGKSFFYFKKKTKY